MCLPSLNTIVISDKKSYQKLSNSLKNKAETEQFNEI